MSEGSSDSGGSSSSGDSGGPSSSSDSGGSWSGDSGGPAPAASWGHPEPGTGVAGYGPGAQYPQYPEPYPPAGPPDTPYGSGPHFAGTPGYQPGYPYAHGYVAPRPGPSASTIALAIISALVTMSCYFTIAGLPALVLAIVALVRVERDPAGAERLTKIGWIVLGVATVLVIVIFVVGVALLGATIFSTSSTTSTVPSGNV